MCRLGEINRVLGNVGLTVGNSPDNKEIKVENGVESAKIVIQLTAYPEIG